MSTSKRIFSGVVWSIIANVVNSLYGFLMVPILINYFGKAEYGLIGLAQSVNAYMRLMDMGLTSTNVRFFSNWLAQGDKEKVNKLFSTCTSFYGIVGIINAAVLLAIAFFSESIFNVTPEQNIVLYKLLIILAVSAIVNWLTSCYNQLIKATENVAWTEKRILLTKMLMILAIILTVILKLNITTYVILTVICNWVILPWVVRKIRQLLPFISFSLRFDKSVFKEILPYTLNVFSFSIFSLTYKELRPVFLGIQGTVESVTDYKVIMGIVGVVSAISGVFLSALLPSSSRVIAQNDKKAYYRIAYQGTKYLMLFTTFLVFGMVTIGKDLLVIYVGEEYNYLTCWLNVFLLLLISNHILANSSLILGGSNIRPLSKMTAFSTVLALIVAWFLIPELEIGGVAIASAVYTIVQLFFYYVYYWPKVLMIDSFGILRTIFIPIFFAGLLIWLGISYMPPFSNHWINIFVYGSLYSIAFLVFSILYLNREEKQYFKGFILSNKYLNILISKKK